MLTTPLVTLRTIPRVKPSDLVDIERIIEKDAANLRRQASGRNVYDVTAAGLRFIPTATPLQFPAANAVSPRSQIATTTIATPSPPIPPLVTAVVGVVNKKKDLSATAKKGLYSFWLSS